MVDISVVVPVFNVEKYLRDTLDSIIGQTIKSIEIICVNDGSTDNSKAILEEYAAKDSRIKLLMQDNSGAGVARNNGLKIAAGKYVAFLDGDDIYEPDMLKKMYSKAEKYSLDVVVCRSDKFSGVVQNSIANSGCIKKYLLPNQEIFSSFDVKKNFFMLFIWWPWDKLFRLDYVKQLDIQYQSLRTTNDLYFVAGATIAAKRISCVDEVLAHHRVGDKSTLSVTREKSWECYKLALDELKKFLIKHDLMGRFGQDFVNYSLHFSLWQLETLKGKSYFLLYEKLRKEWFSDLDIVSKSEKYFYDANLYRMMKYIVGHNRSKVMKGSRIMDNIYYNMLSYVERVRVYKSGYGFKKTIKKIMSKYI